MTIIAIILFCLGLFAFTGTTIGIVRFPDYLTKSHAASTGDTMSTGLLILSIMFFAAHDWHHASWIILLKLGILLLFMLIASPTASHVLTQAGYKVQAPRWRKTKEGGDKGHES